MFGHQRGPRREGEFVVTDGWSRIVELLRRDELVSGVWDAACRRLHLPQIQWAFIMVADLSDPPGSQLPADQSFGLCEAAEAARYLDTLPAEDWEHAMNQAAYADRLMHAHVGDELAYWNWLQVDRADVPRDVLAALPDGSRPAGLFGGFTRPTFRGRGLFTNGNRWLMDRLAEEGFTHLFCRSEFRNAASVRSRLRGGYAIMGEAATVLRRGERISRRTRLFLPPIPGTEAQCERSHEISRRGQRAIARALAYEKPDS